MNLKMITSFHYLQESQVKVGVPIAYMLFVSTKKYQYFDIVSLIFITCVLCWFILPKGFWLQLQQKHKTNKLLNNIKQTIKRKKSLKLATRKKKDGAYVIKQFR